jgi:diadenylate cyclase
MIPHLDPSSFSFGVPDAIDILATSVLIYYLLLLIRGTRAVQIVLGLLTLVIVLGLSNLLHLLVLATVMQYLLLGTAVTLPIVFQPELRRALEQIGRGRFFRRAAADDEAIAAELVGIVAAAAFRLAREGTGALIVVEERTGLREYVESGTALDAKLSVELLLAIFNKQSPLHDGAVVVRDLLVEGAACFLPLSENAIVAERHLGTRHRAAIGLTEVADAVVVVVSEETRTVSVARAGRLSVRIDDEERLRKVLEACIRPRRAHPAEPPLWLANLLTRLTRASGDQTKLRA